ncbi:MAG: efflux RND transporter periplasmic adaptor subunit [bacterium]
MHPNKLSIIAILLVFPALIWLAYASRASDIPEKPSEAVAVRTAPVVTKVISFPIHTSGNVASKAEMYLSFKVGGVLRKLHVDEGAKVKKGQALAVLDMAEISAQVAQAKSGFEKAERDYARARNLYADSVATLEQMQDAETALEVAKASLKIAEFNAQYAKIVAPANGKILKRYVEANELIAPGSKVFKFGSTEKDWVVRVSVIDRDVVRLQLDDSASVEFDVYPDKPFAGIVSEIAEAADPATGTFEVEVTLKPDTRKIVSGFFAHVDIFPSEQKSYSFIPIEALYEGDGLLGYVFAIDSVKSTAHKHAIRIARILDRELAVASGLENIANVVTDGAAYLADGRLVKVVE